MDHKAKLSVQDELAFSKARLIELETQPHATKLAAALDSRLREFHARKVAELTEKLAALALASHIGGDSRPV